MDSNGSKRKVVITDDTRQTIFTLNTQTDPHSLQIQSKQLQSSAQFWGSFKLEDLDAHSQAIFDKIDSLYHYISEKSQQVEIEGKFVKIIFSFLKQSKTVTLELSEMVRCSADAQRKLNERLKHLEIQNKTLMAALKDQGNGIKMGRYQKVTLPVIMQAINFDSYKFTNFRQISPVSNNYLRNLFKLHPSMTLPQSGLWTFQFTVTSVFKEPNKSAPSIQMGIKNEHNQTVVLSLNSLPTLQANNQGESLLIENDFIQVILNMDGKMMAICRNFNETEPRLLSWQTLKGDKLWLSLRLYMVSIKTDLFVAQSALPWEIPVSK